MELFLSDSSLVFTGALVLMLALALLQLIGLGGFDTDFDMDADLGMDGDLSAGPVEGMLSLLGFGKVPLMILLSLFLASFGVIGLAGQSFMQSLIGAPLTPWLAVPAAAIVALPITGALARPIGRIMPRDETTAVSTDALVGRFATVQIGSARTGSPARAKCTDRHGQPHFVMIEPDNAGQVLSEGEEVLLVRREGELFKAIARGDQYLPRLEP